MDLIIPRIIHQIWVGPNPLTEQIKEYSKSWQDFHPDWEYKLWTDKEVAELDLINQNVYDNASTWAGKADVLRYELLYNYGGVYIDIDFSCNRNMEPIIQYFDFFIHTQVIGCWAEDCPDYLCNSFIGATPKHKFLKILIDNMEDWVNGDLDNSGYRTPKNETGPIYVSYMLKDENVPLLPADMLNGYIGKHNYFDSWHKDWGKI